MKTENTNKSEPGCTPNHSAIKLKEKTCTVARIIDFTVTTDSVVAKAVVVTDRKTHLIEVDWGDGEKSNINIRFASHFKVPAFDGGNALQPGTYEFFHRYNVTYVETIFRANLNHPAPMDYLVTLKTIDFNGDFDLSLQEITIEPAYRINFYQLYVGLKNECDSDRTNEFTIKQSENGVVKKEWSWFPSNQFFYATPTFNIPQSELSQIFTVTNSTTPTSTNMQNIRFDFIEHDTWYDDAGALSYPRTLYFYLNDEQDSASGRLEGEVPILDSNPLWQNSCEVMYAVDWELRLIVPMPPSQPALFTKS